METPRRSEPSRCLPLGETATPSYPVRERFGEKARTPPPSSPMMKGGEPGPAPLLGNPDGTPWRSRETPTFGRAEIVISAPRPTGRFPEQTQLAPNEARR